MDLKAAIIGCGKPWRSEGATGFGISHGHAKGYAANPGVRLVALADVVEENARAFQEQHGAERIYTDYNEMLEKERPDIVSICTWTGLHERMVLDCAAAKVPAVYCEKPIAPTWGAAKRMVEACKKSGTMLIFNHQRRFDPAYVQARDLIRAGKIGELRTIEMPTSNVFDWGTHWFDMMFFYNEQVPAKWVLGQVDPIGGPTIFGVQVEGQAISYVGFENGVNGVMPTGKDQNWGVQNRIIGTEGVIEIGATGWDSLRYWRPGEPSWVELDTKLPEGEPDAFGKAVADLAASLREGREPELSARKALMATELIFATYLSAREGGRVDLPLAADDVAIYAE